MYVRIRVRDVCSYRWTPEVQSNILSYNILLELPDQKVKYLIIEVRTSCISFFRWCEKSIASDGSLQELAKAENWTLYLGIDPETVQDFKIYRRICFQIFKLR